MAVRHFAQGQKGSVSEMALERAPCLAHVFRCAWSKLKYNTASGNLRFGMCHPVPAGCHGKHAWPAWQVCTRELVHLAAPNLAKKVRSTARVGSLGGSSPHWVAKGPGTSDARGRSLQLRPEGRRPQRTCCASCLPGWPGLPGPGEVRPRIGRGAFLRVLDAGTWAEPALFLRRLQTAKLGPYHPRLGRSKS